MSDSHCIQIKIKAGVLEFSVVITSDMLDLDAIVVHGPIGEASEDILHFRRFANRAMTNYGIKIKHIRSGNGTKFKNTGLDTYLDTLGITHEFSAPYTPQQNDIMEPKNRTLIEMARTMLDEYKTPRKFWPEAIDTACHIINRVYLHKLLKKTSYELLTGKKPNVSYFRVFGARC